MTDENKELPEGLVEELEDALTGVFGHSHAIARLALSVIAPHYEKQIAELKAQIPQWLPIESAPKYGQVLLRLKSSMFVFGYRGKWGWVLGSEINETDEAFISHWMHLPKPPAE